MSKAASCDHVMALAADPRDPDAVTLPPTIRAEQLERVTSPQFDAMVPLVTVDIATYNHERFIRRAVESALSQRTTFPFEIIIGEDCSTDRTREIVRELQRMHPDRIKLLLQQANVGCSANLASIRAEYRGRYVAFLEGDDYWTDPSKLQRQVDFMETHPACMVCHHRIEAVDDATGAVAYEFPEPEYRRTADWKDLLRVNFIQTCSTVYRREALIAITPALKRLKMLDWVTALFAARRGSIGYIDRGMAVYRLHGASMWQARPYEERFLHTIESFNALEAALDPGDRAQVAPALNETIYHLSLGCSTRARPDVLRRIAGLCLERAVRSRGARAGLLQSAIRLGVRGRLGDRRAAT